MLGVVPTVETLVSRWRLVSACVVGVVALLAGIAWVSGASAPVRDLGAERRALEARLSLLNAQALAPGSALACLDALAGESVETACEKALFASPASVAGATSYAAARFDLLADLVAYSKHGGRDIDGILGPLRRSLENDRFGFVAHMLAVRDGCSSQNCGTLALLRDASRVRANLSGVTLDRYVEHYVTVWNQASDSAVADAAPTASSGPSGNNNAPPHHMVNIDFPTAASIPAISIMNPEPKGPPTASGPASVAAGSPGADPNAAAAAKRAHKQAGNAPAPATSATLAPSAPVDPVWLPGTVPAAAQAATASAPPSGGTPLQLSPVQPEGSANNSRAQ